MDFQTIIDLDKQLLLFFNGSESLFLDAMVTTLTNAWTWVPLYISLLIVVIKNSDSVLGVFLVLASAALCVLFTGTLDDTIVKPLVGRWRPTRDPEIGLLVDIVDGYRGGNYGFFLLMPPIRSASPSSSVCWCVAVCSRWHSSFGRSPIAGLASIWAFISQAISSLASYGALSWVQASIASIAIIPKNGRVRLAIRHSLIPERAIIATMPTFRFVC